MSWFSLTPASSPVTLPVTLPGAALPSAPVRTVASLASLCCAMLALGRRSQPVLPQPGSGELRPSPSFWRKRGPWRFNCCSEGSGEPHPSTTQAAGGPQHSCPASAGPEYGVLGTCWWSPRESQGGSSSSWGVSVGQEPQREQLTAATDPAGGQRCQGAPLAANLPAISNLFPPARSGSEELGWAVIPGIFPLNPNNFQ